MIKNLKVEDKSLTDLVPLPQPTLVPTPEVRFCLCNYSYIMF